MFRAPIRMAVAMALGLGVAQAAQAQAGPEALSLTGTLYQATGDAVSLANVDFRVEIWDKADVCRLYSETHLAQDLSATAGTFSLVIGSGSAAQNYIGGSTHLDVHVFANPGPVSAFSGCANPPALNAGDQRNVHVYYDLGSGMIALTPSVPVLASAYAIVAETLQGKTPDQFIQVNASGSTALSQTNAEYAFSAANWPRLKALVDGTSSQYLGATPTAPIDAHTQRLVNVADPTAAQDAATKNYVDTTFSGKPLDVSAVGPMTGGGAAIVWDATNNKWTTGSVTASGAAGGDLTGQYPNPTLGPNVVTSAKLADGAVTAAKIATAGIGVNRLVMSDNTTGGALGFATCAQNEILKFDVALGWSCTSVSSIAPVTSVAGKTGAVTLNAGDISNLGTAALLNYGSAANQAVALDASARLPAVDGSQLTNVKLGGRTVASTLPTAGQVLSWNQMTSVWEPGASATGPWLTNGANVYYSAGNVGLGTNAPGAPLSIAYTTPSTSAGTGALVVAGGVGIGGNVFTSGNLTTTGAITAQFAPVTGNSVRSGVGASVANFASDSTKAMTFSPDGTERLRLAVGGAVGIGTTAPAAGLDVNLTGANSAIALPRDSSANRPSTAIAGMIRFNTDLNAVEIFSSGAWTSLAGSATVGSVTNVGTGVGLIGGPITTTGTLKVDVGSAAGQIVQENASAQIAQSPGTAAAPAYAFATDLASGLFSPGAGQVAISTSGTTALAVNADGTVVVPSTINSNNSSTGALRVAGGLGVAGQISAGSNTLSPQFTAFVSNPATYQSSSTSATAPSGPGVYLYNINAADGNDATINFYNQNAANTQQAAYISAFSTTSGYAGTLAFGQRTGANAYAERVRIDASGRVGIGTTAPVVALDVAGAVRPGDSTTVTTCGSGSAGAEGSMRYNYASHFMEYCNGTTWIQITAQAAGAVTPVNASGPPVSASTYSISSVNANYTPGFGAIANTYNGNWPVVGSSSSSNPNCAELDSSSAQQIVYDLGALKSIGNVYISATGPPYGYMAPAIAFSSDGVTFSSSVMANLNNASSVQYQQMTLSTAQSARYVRVTNGGYSSSTDHSQSDFCQIAFGP